MNTQLTDLGDALERAVAVKIQGAPAPSRVRRWRSPRVAALVAVVAVAVPAGTYAATVLLSNSQVAVSMPAGALSLAGTNPTCTTVVANVEYHCTLSSAPSNDGGPAAGQWLGTLEPTVDASKHVNGGCRSLNGPGTIWECYIGEAAVTQNIIGETILGNYVSSPGSG
jgi:hypothetical protein